MRKDERRLFLFRRSHRRHLPLEGRERLDLRGRRSDQHLPGHRRRQCLWRRPSSAATAAPAWPRSSATDSAISARCTRISQATCRTMRGRCSCASSPSIEVTGTFKQKKVDLVREGFDPAAITDPIYFNDPQAKAFVPLDAGALPADRERRRPAVIAIARRRAGVLARSRPEANGSRRTSAFDDDIRGALPRDLRGGRRRTSLPTGSGPPRARSRSSIVLDQFPRNMFRGDARTFAADPLARAVAERALARGFDRQVPSPEWQFFYLPFEHSESLPDQERCCALFAATGDADLSEMGGAARRHHPRFGRFPASQRGARPRHDARRAGLSRRRRLHRLGQSLRPTDALDVAAKAALNIQGTIEETVHVVVHSRFLPRRADRGRDVVRAPPRSPRWNSRSWRRPRPAAAGTRPRARCSRR